MVMHYTQWHRHQGLDMQLTLTVANGFEFDQPEIVLSNMVKFEVPFSSGSLGCATKGQQ